MFHDSDGPNQNVDTNCSTEEPDTQSTGTSQLLQALRVEQNQSHSMDSEITSTIHSSTAIISPCIPISDNPTADEPLSPSPCDGPVIDPYNTQSYLPTWFSPVTSHLDCTHCGRTYFDDKNDFGLDIPVGAIPEGSTISIDIGVALYGPFQFPQGVRPVSPVFWICVRQTGFSQFIKPIIVTLPHFLSLKNKETIQSLRPTFLKAKHEMNQNQMYEFLPADGTVYFELHKKSGVLQTTHFCSLCITCEDTMEAIKNVNFCVSAVIPRAVSPEKSSYADFYITFLIKTCLTKLTEQLQDSLYLGETERQEFQFEGERDQSLELVLPNSEQDSWAFGYRRKKRVIIHIRM